MAQLQVGKFNDCYNVGKISIEKATVIKNYIGGFVGKPELWRGETFKLLNCYTATVPEVKNDEANCLTGSFAGKSVSDRYLDNCYSVEKGKNYWGNVEDNVTGNNGNVTEEYMKSNEFVELLNSKNDNNIWKIDANVNNGFPHF